MPRPARWTQVHPRHASQLSDSRRQLHHAAQLATALGISFLPHVADDSHTNLEWLPEHRALASNAVRANEHWSRIGVRVHDLTLLMLRENAAVASYSLHNHTIAQATDWLRTQLDQLGLPSARYSLLRHYEIPAHPVGGGTAFSVNEDRLEELSRWFGNAALVLESVRVGNEGEAVRCWPHHFDIATLVHVRRGATVGVGLEPGDEYYDEPYFYVNAHPQPDASALTDALQGAGLWHTREWVGAVLPGSRLGDDGQEEQVISFLESAVRSCRSLLC